MEFETRMSPQAHQPHIAEPRPNSNSENINTPEYSLAKTEAAIQLARAGRRDEARKALLDLLAIDPDFAPAHCNLGVMHAECGEKQQAIESLRRAIALRPGYVEAHRNLGGVLSSLGKAAEAAESYRAALALEPNSWNTLTDFGLVLTRAGRAAEAVVYLRQAIHLNPAGAEAHNNLGIAFGELARLDDAEAAYHQALKCDPRHVEAHTNLAGIYAQQGKPVEGAACCQIALWLKPDSVSAHWHRALALLQLGQFEEGFAEYEWRWRRQGVSGRQFQAPLWNGEPLDGKTILIYMEQGLGDALQFVRYVPMVVARGGRVALECREPLLQVLGGFPGVDQLVPEGSPLPKFDVHAPLMSLPFIFKTTLETIPPPAILAPNERLVEQWRERLAGNSELKVGLAWQGNPHHKWDHHRSIPLKRFAKLAEIPQVQLFSLQRGPGSDQVAKLDGRFEIKELLDPAQSDRAAWAEVAALMKNLDLVISVDTATAHLAGSLGVPVWVALPKASDWRWLLDREDSPWYPSMRLFRQQRQGDWDDVIEEIDQCLKKRALLRANAGEAAPI